MRHRSFPEVLAGVPGRLRHLSTSISSSSISEMRIYATLGSTIGPKQDCRQCRRKRAVVQCFIRSMRGPHSPGASTAALGNGEWIIYIGYTGSGKVIYYNPKFRAGFLILRRLMKPQAYNTVLERVVYFFTDVDRGVKGPRLIALLFCKLSVLNIWTRTIGMEQLATGRWLKLFKYFTSPC